MTTARPPLSAGGITNESDLALFLARPKRLLLVEDDARVREMFIEFCRSYNAVIEQAKSGEDALRMIQASESYDVILLDIKLPGMDGPLFFQELRQIGNKAPVVFISGFLDEEVIRNVNRVGFACFVLKPPAYNDEFAHNLMTVLGVRRVDANKSMTFSLRGWGQPVTIPAH
jgi:CheY-like chemotaxis protein